MFKHNEYHNQSGENTIRNFHRYQEHSKIIFHKTNNILAHLTLKQCQANQQKSFATYIYICALYYTIINASRYISLSQFPTLFQETLNI